jgi:hypothetical protein
LRSWKTIATVGANLTKYPGTRLPDSTNCAYRVRAVNAIGYASASKVASVDTPQAVKRGVAAHPLAADQERLNYVRIDAHLRQLGRRGIPLVGAHPERPRRLQ